MTAMLGCNLPPSAASPQQRSRSNDAYVGTAKSCLERYNPAHAVAGNVNHAAVGAKPPGMPHSGAGRGPSCLMNLVLSGADELAGRPAPHLLDWFVCAPVWFSYRQPHSP